MVFVLLAMLMAVLGGSLGPAPPWERPVMGLRYSWMDGTMRRTRGIRRGPALLLALVASLGTGCITWDEVHDQAVARARAMTGPPAAVRDMGAFDAAIDMMVTDVLGRLRVGFPAPPTEDEILDLHLEYQEKADGEDWTIERVDPTMERVGVDPFAIPDLTPPAPGDE